MVARPRARPEERDLERADRLDRPGRDRGPETIVLKLKHPDPSIIPALATFNTAILPEKKFEAEPGATDAEKAKTFAEHPVGTGPFVLKSWQRGAQMELVKNPYHWRKGEDGKPLPYLDAVRFEIIPDDATRILKLQAGELDGAEFIPYSRVAELKADPRLAMELYPSTRVFYSTMNVRPKLSDGSDNPLSNPKVRQALNYATEKNAIIADRDAQRRQADGLLHVLRHAAALERRARLYPLRPGQGQAAAEPRPASPSGFPVKLIVLAGNADETAVGTALQQMWAQVGVKLEPRAARQRHPHRPLPQGRLPDAAVAPGPTTSPTRARSPPTSSTTPTSRRCTRAGRTTRPTSCSSRASRRPTRPSARTSTSASSRSTMESGPILYIYETPYPVALQKRVKGFVQIPLGNNIFAAT